MLRYLSGCCKMSTERRLISDRAIQIIADNKIRAAIEAGEFNNLPGFGQPLVAIDEPYDPNWWVRSKLKREELRIDFSADRPLR
jgi:hypothetical protein